MYLENLIAITRSFSELELLYVGVTKFEFGVKRLRLEELPDWGNKDIIVKPPVSLVTRYIGFYICKSKSLRHFLKKTVQNIS